MLKAHAIPVPSDCVLAPLYVGADLLDAFAVHLPAGANDDLEVLARAGFERQAWWIRALTRVRDGQLGQMDVGAALLTKLRAVIPDLSASWIEATSPYVFVQDRARLVDGLARAGLR